MANKKDIGRAYKEALENYSMSPHNRVWDNIEKGLNKPNRRVFPFWILAVGLLLIIPLTIYIVKNPINNNYTPEHINSSNVDDTSIDHIIVDRNQNNSNINNPHIQSNDSITETRNSATKDNLLEKGVISNNPRTNDKANSNNTNFASTNSDNNYRQNKNDKTQNKGGNYKRENTNVYHKNDQVTSNVQYDTGIPNNRLKNESNLETIIKLESQSVVSNNSKIIGSFEFKDTVEVEPKKENAKKGIKKMTLKAYGGPTYFNTLSKGFTLSEFLETNETQGNIKSSYGIAAEFELTEKSSISFGVGKINLGHTTLSADSIISVDFEGIFLRNSWTYDYLDLNDQANNLTATTLGDHGTVLDFRQEISYIEVPIVYSYNLVENNKFKLNANGGISFLTLTENRIIAESPNGKSLRIGSANNLNKLNLSVNLGASISYPISNRLSIFTEPVFKYYLKTFNRDNSFKPYSLGLNFGIMYKF